MNITRTFLSFYGSILGCLGLQHCPGRSPEPSGGGRVMEKAARGPWACLRASIRGQALGGPPRCACGSAARTWERHSSSQSMGSRFPGETGTLAGRPRFCKPQPLHLYPTGTPASSSCRAQNPGIRLALRTWPVLYLLSLTHGQCDIPSHVLGCQALLVITARGHHALLLRRKALTSHAVVSGGLPGGRPRLHRALSSLMNSFCTSRCPGEAG